MNKEHAIKIEDLDITTEQADAMEVIFHNALRDMGYSKDYIEAVECRHRDGFKPYAHNKGGLEARCYLDQYTANLMYTGFTNTDEVLDKNEKYDLECFLLENELTEIDHDNEEQLQQYNEYCQNTNDTVEFMTRFMVLSENEVTLFMSVSASDSPYHRTSDDNKEIKIKFKTLSQLEIKIKKAISGHFAKAMKSNIIESY